MIAQQHQSDIALSLRVAETDPEPARIPSVAQRAGKLLAFDAAGNPTTALPVADSSTELRQDLRSEEHTSELQSLMRISYAVFCLKKKIQNTRTKKELAKK